MSSRCLRINLMHSHLDHGKLDLQILYPTDGLGSNIKIDFRGTSCILRVLPRFKEEINEEWIADKIRFSYDGLGRQRILTPLGKKDGSFKKLDWENALGQTRNKFDSCRSQ